MLPRRSDIFLPLSLKGSQRLVDILRRETTQVYLSYARSPASTSVSVSVQWDVTMHWVFFLYLHFTLPQGDSTLHTLTRWFWDYSSQVEGRVPSQLLLADHLHALPK